MQIININIIYLIIPCFLKLKIKTINIHNLIKFFTLKIKHSSGLQDSWQRLIDKIK